MGDCSNAAVSGPSGGAAPAQARRGRPHRHPADPRPRVWSARWPRACAVPAASSGPGWSRSRTSTSSCIPAATSTSSPRSRPSTRSPPTSSATTAATPAPARCWRPPSGWPARSAPRRPALHRLTVGGAARGGRRQPAPGTGARCLPAARHGHRRLGAGADRMRPLRGAGPAPGVPHRRRRQRVRALPAVRVGDTRRRACWT